MNSSPSGTETPPDKGGGRLLTFSSGGWVLMLSGFFCLVAAGLVLWPVIATGGHRSVGDGVHLDTYGFDLSNLTIPKDSLVPSGVAKDEIRAIPPQLVETATPEEIDLIHKNERLNFLVGSDKVIGMAINGEVRAYPLRVLTQHEVVNDVLGGVPIAVTWSPLCGAAVVFDRRIDGPTTAAAEFGVSGLLLDSDLVMFDRRGEGKGESLWPQLTLKAVSGPRVGHTLPLLSYELVTWESWRKEHPDTKALLGLRTLKEVYTQEPYNTYLSNDALRFPVYPVWDKEGVAKKTEIEVTGSLAKGWVARREAAATVAATGSAPASRPVEITLHSFVFAWYAQHEKDTDYSGLK